MLPESSFYLSKTTLFVMSAKKQTRQSNAKSRRNQHRKHHRKATCAEHVDATVSPPVLVPENHEKSHFFHPDGLILGPDRSPWLIFASKLALQGRSELDRASNGPTRIDPRVAQSHPEAPKSTPQRGKWSQKCSQDRFSSRIWCRTTFEGDFRLIFHRFSIKIVSDNDWRIDRDAGESIANFVAKLRRS